MEKKYDNNEPLFNKNKRDTLFNIVDDRVLRFIELSMLRTKYINMHKLKNKIFDALYVEVSIPYLYKLIKKLNFIYKTKKRKVIICTKREKKKQERELLKKIKIIGIKNIISIDETGISTNSFKKKGWAKKKKECYYKASKLTSKKYSMIAAISYYGLVKYIVHKKSINSIKFNDFMFDLFRTYGNTKVYFMDNASIHKNEFLKQYISNNNIQILYNLPYSPEYNPIELLFSPLKNSIYSNETKTLSNIMKIIKLFFETFPSESYGRYFNKSFSPQVR